jgi:hypothetical protein
MTPSGCMRSLGSRHPGGRSTGDDGRTGIRTGTIHDVGGLGTVH